MMYQYTQPRYRVHYNHGEKNGGYSNNYGSTADMYASLKYGTRKYKHVKQPPTKSTKYWCRDTSHKQVVKDQNGNPNFRISSAKGTKNDSESKKSQQNCQIPSSTNSSTPAPLYNPYYGGAKEKNSANIVEPFPSQASENTPYQRFKNLERGKQRFKESSEKEQGKQTGYQYQYQAQKAANRPRQPLRTKPPLSKTMTFPRPNQPVKAYKGELPPKTITNLEKMGKCCSSTRNFEDVPHTQRTHVDNLISDLEVPKPTDSNLSSRGKKERDQKRRIRNMRMSNCTQKKEMLEGDLEAQDSYRKRQMKLKTKASMSKFEHFKKRAIECKPNPAEKPKMKEIIPASQRGQTLERRSDYNKSQIQNTSIQEEVNETEERNPMDYIESDPEKQKQSVREERNPYHSKFQDPPVNSEYHDEEMPVVTKPKRGITLAPARAKFAMLDSGLPDLGNTSYMNSTLQALSPLTTLIPFLETFELDFNSDGDFARQEFDVLKHFCRVMEHLRDGSFDGDYRYLKSLWWEITMSDFQNDQKDDSHRFFNFMFDKINDYKQAFPQIELGEIPFKMTIKHVSECCEKGCDFTQESEETAYCLTLPVQRDSLKANLNEFYLPKQEYDQECVKCSFRHTLVEAEHQIDIMTENMEYLRDRKRANLEKEINVVFEQANLIEDLLNWPCFNTDKALREFNSFCRQPGYQTKCIPYMKVCTTQTERKVIGSLPETLCIHLNRSSVQVGRTIRKDQKFIQFPTSFNSEKLMKDYHTSANYVLKSTIIHSGETENGHYTTHRQDLPKLTDTQNTSDPSVTSTCKKWVSASNEVVREIGLSEVKESEAYMLFYETE